MKGSSSSLVQQCLELLKREDIKKELKLLLTPITDFILYEITPYIYMLIFFLFILFIMILAILILLILLLRSKQDSLMIPISSVSLST